MTAWRVGVAIAAAGVALTASVVHGAVRGGAPAAVPCREWTLDPAHARAASRARPLAVKLWRGLRAPGAAVAVAVRGRVVWAYGCGFRDRRRRLPVTPTTTFRVGSVSKTITSAALARLVADGRVDLDAPIQRYVPAFPEKPFPVTVRALATHTAGIRHYETAAEVVNRTHYATVGAALTIFANDPLLFEPGTRFSYSSYGWNLVGAAIEGATKRPYEEAVRDLVLEPLRLRFTHLDEPRGRTTLYELTDGGVVRAPQADLSDRWPSGGFDSTSGDLARFASAFANAALAPRAIVRSFFEPVTIGGTSTHYGIGWEVGESPVGTLAGHTGSVVGGGAGVLVHVPTATAIAITANAGTVTSGGAPKPGTPDPPLLLLPFVEGG